MLIQMIDVLVQVVVPSQNGTILCTLLATKTLSLVIKIYARVNQHVSLP